MIRWLHYYHYRFTMTNINCKVSIFVIVVILIFMQFIAKSLFHHATYNSLYNNGSIQYFKKSMVSPIENHNYSKFKDYDKPTKEANISYITCLLITSPSHHELANHLTNTWMNDCFVIQTMTSKPDTNLKNITLSEYKSYDDLWGKVLDGFLSLNPSTSDWFMKVDDDTYVVMENLKQFLQHLDPRQPLSIGLQLIYPNNEVPIELSSPYMSGGCGYILSREALKRLQNSKDKKYCSYKPWSPYEDVNMGACLQNLGIQQVDTRDSLGRQRFVPFAPWIMMNPSEAKTPSRLWVKEESKYPILFGAEHLTDEPISFHEIRNVNDIYQLYYFTKYLKNVKFSMT